MKSFFLEQTDKADLKHKFFIILDPISRELSLFLHAYVGDNGGLYCECPVIGSKQHAEALRLQVLFAGTCSQFNEVRPLLCCFGTPKLVGPVGCALPIKFAHKALSVMNLLGFATAIALLRGLGGDANVFLEAIKSSPFFLPIYGVWNEKIAKKEYGKDVSWTPQQISSEIKVVLSEASSVGIDSRLLRDAAAVFDEAAESPHRFHDFTSVFDIVARKLQSPQFGPPLL